MNLVVGTRLVQYGEYPIVAVIVKDHQGSVLELEFEDDGSIHDYWTKEEIELLFYEFEYGMILYCRTGKSSFVSNWKAGYYKTSEFNVAKWLGTTLAGSTQKEFQKAYKMKAFW